jgi:hypothetical protein
VNATADELAQLVDCQVILHLDEQNHYVVLAGIDGEFVRLIDLDRNGFYYRVPVAQFAADRRRVALLVSDRPLVVAENMARIDPSSLEGIAAASSCQDCNTKIQSASDGGCRKQAGDCTTHTQYYERWSCGVAASGTCTESDMPMEREENCQPDRATGICTGDGEWVSTPGSACR